MSETCTSVKEKNNETTLKENHRTCLGRRRKYFYGQPDKLIRGLA